MPAVALTGRKKRDTGLKTVQLSYDEKTKWGWVCWTCSEGKPFIISQSGYVSRDSARRAGQKHEKRRGHR